MSLFPQLFFGPALLLVSPSPIWLFSLFVTLDPSLIQATPLWSPGYGLHSALIKHKVPEEVMCLCGGMRGSEFSLCPYKWRNVFNQRSVSLWILKKKKKQPKLKITEVWTNIRWGFPLFIQCRHWEAFLGCFISFSCFKFLSGAFFINRTGAWSM